jgi:hypothetical protein
MIGFMWKEKSAISTEVQNLQTDLIAVKAALDSSRSCVSMPGSRNKTKSVKPLRTRVLVPHYPYEMPASSQSGPQLQQEAALERPDLLYW